MKNNLRSILFLLVILSFVSCQNSISVLLGEKKVKFNKDELLKIEEKSEDEDMAAILSSINEALLSLEVKDLSAKLDILETSTKGIWAFSIDSKMERVLRIEIYDEEGFELLVNHNLDIKQGVNNIALDVKTYKNGTYIFRVKDVKNNEEKVLNFKIKN
jgi:hypothetical protein